MLQSILLLLVAPAGEPVEWAQLSIEQRVIIRVPMAKPARKAPPPKPDEWEEKKGPKCVALRSIKAASILVPDGIDLILDDNHRYRARLEKGCRSTSFYTGFYVEPSDDGSLCSGRDEMQARNGFACGISTFKRLVPDD